MAWIRPANSEKWGKRLSELSERPSTGPVRSVKPKMGEPRQVLPYAEQETAKVVAPEAPPAPTPAPTANPKTAQTPSFVKQTGWRDGQDPQMVRMDQPQEVMDLRAAQQKEYELRKPSDTPVVPDASQDIEEKRKLALERMYAAKKLNSIQ